MKKLSLFVVFVSLLVISPAFAEQPVETEETMPLDMTEPEANQCLLEESAPSVVLRGSCSATADCWDGTSVSCNGSTSCYSYDHSCTAFRGYVNCDGNYTYCTSCPDCIMDGRKCRFDSECQRTPPDWCGTHCRCDMDPMDPHGFCMCY